MAENTKTYRFGDHVIEAAADLDVEDVRTAWKESHPALENAQVMLNDNGEYEFYVSAGNKG